MVKSWPDLHGLMVVIANIYMPFLNQRDVEPFCALWLGVP